MLRVLSRNAAQRLATRLEQTSYLQQRAMSLPGMKGYDDRETAEENIFFKKEEEKVLRKLLSKVRQDVAKADAPAAKAAEDEEMKELDALLGKYNVSGADKKKLIDWRHQH